MLSVDVQRRLPVGAEVQPEGGVHFRVWAPKRSKVEVLVWPPDAKTTADAPVDCTLEAEDDGYFAGYSADAAPGSRYYYRLDEEDFAYPDYASRFQPLGVHKTSEVIDPASFEWTDSDWRGPTLKGQVVYELHIGTFTPEGTWAAAAERLPWLADLGVTLVEVMPVADFHGQFGWGYDGVSWFAPTRLYGRPDDFRRFVDRAHGLGLGVILDVVYNHFGPSGNYIGAFSPHYVSPRHHTEWGDAINFDDHDCGPVREFVASNAAYWISEYHVDGLRLDATQSIYDDSEDHVLAQLGNAARKAAGKRQILIYSENERQLVRQVEPPEQGGYGLDGVWNDDFHHAARVAATGHAEFYYSDYTGSPQELISATKWGYLYQGQWNARQIGRRGTPAWNLTAARYVNFLQNHDQVANSASGLRTHLLTSPGRYRALTALLFVAPGTPLLFMGQEFAASTPFHYFADQEVDITHLVRDGRWEFLRSFPRIAGRVEDAPLPDPSDVGTFEASKLDWNECEKHAAIVKLHRDLIRLRREDPVFSRQDATRLYGAVVGAEAFLLRWLNLDGDDRLVLVNLGRDLSWHPTAEPLSAPPMGMTWSVLWSSEDPRYGGSGTAVLNTKQWVLPGHGTVVLAPTREDGNTNQH